MLKCSNLIHEVTKQRRLSCTGKTNDPQRNNCSVKINQARFQPNQARPSLTSSAPSKHLWLLASGMSCGTGGSQYLCLYLLYLIFIYSLSARQPSRTEKHSVSASLAEKSLSQRQQTFFTLSLFCSLSKRANLFFTLSAEDTALPLDVSSKMDMSCLVYSMLSINKACAITVMATLHWARYPSISSFIQTLVQPL